MSKVLRFNKRKSLLRSPAALLLGATGLGIGAGVASTTGLVSQSTSPSQIYSETVTNCRVVDGDTLHCDSGRVRLLGIDAPELPGHCAQGRECAPGDPFASTHSLEEGLGDGANVKIEKVGNDRYGRMLAMVLGQKGDLSCWQLSHGEAIYKPKWDNGGAWRLRAPMPLRATVDRSYGCDISWAFTPRAKAEAGISRLRG